MNVEDLYPMWIGQARDELEEHVDRMQRGYDRLVHKDSTYGRSVKAMLDLRIRLLETCDAAPRQLDATQPPQDERGIASKPAISFKFGTPERIALERLYAEEITVAKCIELILER